MRTIEQYLRDCLKQNIIYFSIRATEDDTGMIRFYIHPAGKDGDTLDFSVVGNELRTIYDSSDWGSQ